MSKAVFNIDELIKFYDLKGENSKHASSVTGLIGEDLITGIFKHYLESKSPNSKVNVLTENPKEKNGRWLDRWIIQENGNENICYQTEIKNWSAHSLGGVHFEYDPSNPLDFKTLDSDKIFNKIWDDAKMEFKDAAVNKVLKQMKSNAELDSLPSKIIEPLVCFWMPITRSSVKDPIIELNISNANTNFNTVTIFSSSIYLRKLRSGGIITIEIESGQIAARMDKLNNLFSIK
jgi:hypothetical protein